MDNGQDCVAGGQKLILKPRITITCSSIAETLMWKEASNGISYKMEFFLQEYVTKRIQNSAQHTCKQVPSSPRGTWGQLKSCWIL